MRLPWRACPRKRDPNADRPVALSISNAPGRFLRQAMVLALRLGLDHLVEYELAALDAIRAVVGERRVAVLVDRVLAEDRVAVLDLEERVDHCLAVVALVARVLDREQSDLHRLVAVDRVGLGLRAVLRLVVLEERLRGRRV